MDKVPGLAAGRTERLGQDGQDRTAGSGQSRQDRWDRSSGTGHLGQVIWDRSSGTRQLGQDSRDRWDWTSQADRYPGQDREDRKART